MHRLSEALANPANDVLIARAIGLTILIAAMMMWIMIKVLETMGA